ncbi:proteasome subunit beta type-1 isoform X3 [Carlito syrichta]|uniref:Proteasome subunit beta n=1 Tax=Carlito syrichta TaxID=1868482 RepID=A0A3Q0EBM4_CARSF|nr:proteasome subunit beta type-1 isoform X3 [Carlito syrichta]
MSSSALLYAGPGRDLGMEPHGAAGPLSLRFSPYAFNGGTVLAIAGEDFSIVASDTRLSEGFSIHTRDSPKCYKLTDKTVIGCSGFHGDCLTLTKIIEARLKMYKHSNNKAMTTGAIAAMLSTILYSKRFFPYYVYNIIGGLDEEGHRELCTALTQWGPTRETPSRLEAQRVPCFSPCLTTRLVLRTCRTWSTSRCPWTEPCGW